MQSKIRRKPGTGGAPVRRSIRREPVRKLTEAEMQAVEDAKREKEMWGGVAGVVLYGAIIAVLMIGIGAATLIYYDPAAAAREAARFRQCYNTAEGNCVLDGGTIRFERQWVAIAGVDAPVIRGAQCEVERNRGIDAAVRLSDLLNSGTVTLSDPFRDPYGRAVRTVMVDGKDVAKAMISSGVAKTFIGEKRDWCAKGSEPSTADE